MPVYNPQTSQKTINLTNPTILTSYDPTTSTQTQDKQMISTLIQIIKDAKIIP